MTSIHDRILEKLNDLPEPKLREVLDFVESISNEELSQDKQDPFLSVIGMLTGGPISTQEIDQELYGPPATPIASDKGKRQFGSARGLITMSDDFDAPLEDFKEHIGSDGS